MLFVSRVLVPLCWFGAMEWREMQEMLDVRRWRKTGLFDRLLSFNVRLADSRPGGRWPSRGRGGGLAAPVHR